MSIKRDLTQYQWRKNFHLHVWEKIKEHNPSLPRWNYEQLLANGWHLKLGPTCWIELRHKDGSIRHFLLTINGRNLPNIPLLLLGIHGYDDTTRIKYSYVNHALEFFRKLLPGNDNYIYQYRWGTRLWFDFYKSHTNAKEIFKELRDPPLDMNHTYDPNITTAKKFILDQIHYDANFELIVNE